MITLGVKDLDKATNVYTGLGWRISSLSTGNLVVFYLGGIALCLYPRKLLAEDATVDEAGSGFGGVTLSHLALSVEEVEAIMSQARLLGAEIVKPAQKAVWGGYSGYFRDPDGYFIEVAYNPFWQLTEDGSLKTQ